MATLRTLALIPATALLLAACGDSASSSTTGAPSTAPASSSAPDTGVTNPVDTTPITAVDGPVQIDVMVGTDSGPDRIEKVKLGSDVTLNITNPNAADE